MSNRTATPDVFEQLLEDDNAPEALSPASPELEDEASTESPATDEAVTPDSSDAQDNAPAPAAADSSRRRRWLRRVAAGITALLFVAATAAAGMFGWQVKQHNDIAAAGQAAATAATAYAVTLTTVDYQKIDQNFAQVVDGATGDFKNLYTQSSAQLRQLLIDNKAVSHGTVIDSAVKSASKDTVDMLIFVDQSITNSLNPQPRIDRSRISMTMQRVDGRWLASKVDIK